MNRFIKICSAVMLFTSTLISASYGAIQLSNLSLANSPGQALLSNAWAQAFTTGTEGSNIKTAIINVASLGSVSGTATVSIFSDGGSNPLNNGSLGSFSDQTPGNITTAGEYSWVSTTGIELEANTQYWIVVEGNGATARWEFRSIVESAVTSAQPGWDIIEDRSSSSNSGLIWNDYTNSAGEPINNGQFVFALDDEAAIVPEPLHTGAIIGIAMFLSVYCKRPRKRLN